MSRVSEQAVALTLAATTNHQGWGQGMGWEGHSVYTMRDELGVGRNSSLTGICSIHFILAVLRAKEPLTGRMTNITCMN